MKEVFETNSFKRDVKLVLKRHYDIFKLIEIIRILQNGDTLPMRCRNHLLHGNWQGHWECHVGPNWLLIYKVSDRLVSLVRTGTHPDLFDKQ